MIGCGYVGLVSAACFAESGTDVVCIDTDRARIATLEKDVLPIYEPGLAELISENIEQGRLCYSEDFSLHIPTSDLVFISVGTPVRRGEGDLDLTFVHQATKEIAAHLRGYTVIVSKSTVPVGTAEEIDQIIRSINPQAQFDVASNPEFLKQGEALADFRKPDRIVIGVESERARGMLVDLYRTLNLDDINIFLTDSKTAELSKYVCNSFLATKISFINEMAMLCEALGTDIQDVSEIMGLDKRIGKACLRPGPGYGGSCLPKDVQALLSTAQKHGVSDQIIGSVIAVNSAQSAKMIEKITTILANELSSKKIAVLGLTFKPDTNDMRNAPALSILPALLEYDIQLSAYDPQGMGEARKLLPAGVSYADNPYHAAEQADAVLILTEWDIFREMDMRQLRQCMRDNKLIDLRNIYQPADMHTLGFDYHCLGRVS